MATNLARKTAEIASRDVGEVSEHGKNTGHFRITAYQMTVHITPGQPYCAAAVSCWIREAGSELDQKVFFKPSASALGLLRHNQALIIPLEELGPDHLPCVGVIDHGKGNGHAFLIVGMNETKELQTIEANTNGVTDPGQVGSREGQGVRALNTRKVSNLTGAIAIV